MPTYREMREIALFRAEKCGFQIGTAISLVKRSGIVCDVNPFFFDAEPPMAYVNLDTCGKLKAKRRELVSIANLTIRRAK